MAAPVRARLELALLGIAIVAVGGFVISFALGLGRPGGERAVAEPPAPRRAADTYQHVPPPLGRVEVLNRSGRAGMARLATDRLRTGGYDVVYFGNAPASAPDTSVVIDRAGRPEIARGAAARLGITRTATQIDTSLYVDATVIIGVEWERAAGGGNGADGAGAAAAGPTVRERLRGLFRRGD